MKGRFDSRALLKTLAAQPGTPHDSVAQRAFSAVLFGLSVILFAFAVVRFVQSEIVVAAADAAIAAVFLVAFYVQTRGRLGPAIFLSQLVGGFLLHALLFLALLFDAASGSVGLNLVMVSLANILIVAYISDNRRLLLVVSAYAVAFNAANAIRHVLQEPPDAVYLVSAGAFVILGILVGLAMQSLKLTLIRARDEAEEANAAKSMFLSNMSHEIRTPMNGIDGMLRILEEGETSPDRRHYFSLARNASKSLLSIIDDILELSKIETGAYEFREVDFPTRRVIDETAEVLSVNASEKGLKLNLRIDEDTPTFVHGDPDRLKQVLFNVVGNAIKYTEEGRVDIRARVGQRRGKWVLLLFEVEDTGVGMTEEEQAVIFRPFAQADSSYAKRYKGTGLGLALSKRLSESMGGGIWCRSSKGVGSTFWFTSWLQVAEPAGATESEGQPFPAENNLSILVAEDDRINQVVVRKNLEREGHRVKIVGDGRALLDVLPSVKPDLVLMDVQMPDLDGVETTRRIRTEMPESVRGVPVIALTAYVSDEDRKRFIEAGMDAHALKPIDIPSLRETIQSVLAKNRSAPIDSRTKDRY